MLTPYIFNLQQNEREMCVCVHEHNVSIYIYIIPHQNVPKSFIY
jgi:hypothetical protein